MLEPYYQITSRSPEMDSAFAAVGVTRADHRYFANRLGPAGPLGPGMVIALLYGFEPGFVRAGIPSLWSAATPGQLTEARLTGVSATCRRVLGNLADDPGLAEAARIARDMVDAMDLAGRPLAAAHAEVPWPADPATALWAACVALREHRGDGHWAATSAEGLDGVECHVLHAAEGAMPLDFLQQVSRWDDRSWRAGIDRLVDRGLVEEGPAGLALSAAGRDVKLRLERATDRSAAQPLEAVGTDRTERLRFLLRAPVERIMASGSVGAWKLREELWRDLPDPA